MFCFVLGAKPGNDSDCCCCRINMTDLVIPLCTQDWEKEREREILHPESQGRSLLVL